LKRVEVRNTSNVNKEYGRGKNLKTLEREVTDTPNKADYAYRAWRINRIV
jgi:hypothetical protein